MICLVCTGCGMLPSNSSTVPQVGMVAPDFSYERLDGMTERLSDSRGKPVVLNFWATWCAPCREEMPLLQSAREQFGEDVLVLGINSYDDADAISAYADELGISFPLALDPSGDIGTQYRAQMLPLTYFIDEQGMITSIVRGAVDQKALDEQLSSAP